MVRTDCARNSGFWVASLCAALISFLVFMGAGNNDFVDLDDLGYIVLNHNIDRLDWSTVVWAFTRFHEANWHPLTMLSLALEKQIWGLDPSVFHYSNILIHACTVFVSCFLFASILKVVFRGYRDDVVNADLSGNLTIFCGAISGALFFGLHPLRVESVVWASERKDVLCLFFIVSALWWYLRFVDQKAARPEIVFYRFSSYLMVALLSGMALMSKPTAVTLPLVLLILDRYPLARLTDRRSFFKLILEKLPLFIMAGATAVVTMFAQREALSWCEQVTFLSRLLVACKALLFYLLKCALPTNLSPFYPHPGEVAGAALKEYLFYAVVVVVISVAVALLSKRHKLWSAFWLYHVVTLLPMLGILQVGGQWAADRYSYLPSLGMSLVWGGAVSLLVCHLKHKGHVVSSLLVVLVVAIQLAAYSMISLRLIPVWRTTETLTSRVIDLAPGQSGAVYYSRALFRQSKGEYAQALEDVDEAMAIVRRKKMTRMYAQLSMTRASLLRQMGRLSEALAATDWAIMMSAGEPNPDMFGFRNELVQQMLRTENGKPPQ